MRLLACLLLLGCAGSSPTVVSTATPAPRIEIIVSNDSQQDVVVYNLVGVTRERLGRVRALGKGTVYVRWLTGAGLRLALTTAAQFAWESNELWWVRLGDCIELRVSPRLAASSAVPCRGSNE